MSLTVRFEHIGKKYRIWGYSSLRGEIASFSQRLKVPFLFKKRSVHKKESDKYFWAIKDVNFEVKKGEALGIIGANGAGKTTLLKLISGITYPTTGRITTVGRIGSVIEIGAGIHGDLTGRENIFLYGSIIGMSRREIKDKFKEIVEFSELGRFIDEPVKYYSAGMELRLGFSVTIHQNPDIFLIDEVLAVGDESFYHKSLEAMSKIIKGGRTVILVSHNLASIASFCNRAILLEQGHVAAVDSPHKIILLYQSKMISSEKIIGRNGNDEKRWGTGDIVIKNVEFLEGERWLKTAIASSGHGWGLKIEYETKRGREGVIFGVMIYNSKGELVYEENNGLDEMRPPLMKDNGAVIFKATSLALPAGTYFLSLYVHNLSRTIIYDWHDQAYRFEVCQSKAINRSGQLYLDSSWEYQSY